MKRTFTLIFFMLLFAIGAQAQADTIPRLIITETQVVNAASGYVELFNAGDSALDLGSFGLSCFSGNGASQFIYDRDELGNKTKLTIRNSRGCWDDAPNWKKHRTKFPGHVLQPGETFVITRVSDARRWQEEEYHNPYSQQSLGNNEAKMEWGDFFAHYDDDFAAPVEYWLDKPEIESYGKDSADAYFDLLWTYGDAGYALWYFTAVDSFIIDVVNAVLDENDKMTRTTAPIAGEEAAIEYNLLVRKSDISVGNIDWDKSRGTSTEDSEWLLMPRGASEGGRADPIWGPWARTFPYTIGNHDDYSISASSEVMNIDLGAGTLEVPWGTEGGDSIVTDMVLGNGMAWLYIQDTVPGAESLLDSAYTICRDGDILELYAFGTDREKVSLAISVLDPASNMARVFPMNQQLYNEDEDEYFWVTPYGVTEGDPVIDSILYVPYSTRTDTLYKYLEKAPNANWEIVWVDGVERTDVKFGDILKVTAEDGTTIKEHVLSVQDYEASEIAYLSSITWPDYPVDELFDWIRGDTLPAFSPAGLSYGITLPFGTTSVPALVAKPLDFRAMVTIDRATSLSGSIEERTTTITVTSEDESVEYAYKILFTVDLPPELRQNYTGEPFFSEVIHRWWWQIDAVEIYNPGDVDLDLSQYLILAGTATTPADALAQYLGRDSTANYSNRFTKYVPGYVYPDFPTFQAKGWVLEYDPLVNPIVKPHETFDISAQGFPASRPERYNADLADRSEVDMSAYRDNWAEPIESTWGPELAFNNRKNAVDRQKMRKWLFKIVNPDVLNGTQEIGADINDYQLVDCYGFLSTASADWNVGSRNLNTPSNMEWRILRKPHVYEGDLELEAGFGTSDEDSDWVATHNTDSEFPNRYVHLETLGNHQAAPITVHISKLTSTVYKVSSGFDGLQTIQGDLSNTDFLAFLGNIGKADDNQVLVLHSNVDGSVVGDDVNVAGDDTLHVTSANGVNQTSYLLVNQPLDADAMLEPVEGAGITVNVEGSTGTIGNVQYGWTIASVLDSLIVPDLAVLNVVNPDDELISLHVMNYDTILVPTLVSDQVFFEVIAEDGTTIKFQLMPVSLSSDAYVVSDLYTVSQEEFRIKLIPEGVTPTVFMDNVIPVKGATLSILDKLGMERVDGIMAYDDILLVISEDETNEVRYFLDFLEETGIDVNTAPVVELAFADTTIAPGATIELSAAVTDDGYPSPFTFMWEVEAVEGDVADVTISDPTETTTDITFAATGVFTVKGLADDLQLVGEATLNVTVQTPDAVMLVSTPEMLIYPNPASGELHIQLSIIKDPALISIEDVLGKTIYNQVHYNNEFTIDVSDLDVGIYFVRMIAGEKHLIQNVQIIR